MKRNMVKVVSLTVALVMLMSGTMVFGYASPVSRLVAAKSNYKTANGDIIDITGSEMTVRVDSNDMIFDTDRDTALKDEDGSSIDLDDLTEGIGVKVTYDTETWYSKRGTYYADRIDVVRNSLIQNGVSISDIYTKSDVNYVEIAYKSGNKTLEKTLKFVKSTSIYDQFGKDADYDYLQEDMIVDVEYAPSYSSSSYPALYTLRVVKHDSDAETTEDKVIKVEVNKNDSYIYTGTSDNANKQKLFIVDNDTVLRNEKGNAIKIADILKGQTIKVEHSPFSTKSIPPQSYAYTVQVIKAAVSTADDCEIYELLNELFTDYTYEDYLDCIKNHDHDWSFGKWNTSTWPEFGKEEGWKYGWLINGKWGDMDKDSWKEYRDKYKDHDWDDWDDDWEDYYEHHDWDHDWNYDMDDVRATIKSVDTKNSTLDIRLSSYFQNTLTVYVTKDTDIENANGKDISLENLEKGDEIKLDIEYKNGKYYADDIEIVK